MGNPAASLLTDFERFGIGKSHYFIITFLFDEFAEIYGSTIYADRRPSFQSLDFKTEFLELFTDAVTGHLTHSTPRKMLLPNMNQTIQKGSVGKDDRLTLDIAAHHSLNPLHLVAIKKKPYHRILPKVYVGCFLQHTAPFSRKHHLIALASWTPHGRTFRLVEHPKLNHGTVTDNARITTHGIDFTDNLSLGNAAHSRVARHGSKQSQVHSDKQDFAAHIGRCRCRLTARVTCAYNDDIIRFEIHFVSVFHGKQSIYLFDYQYFKRRPKQQL